MSPPLQLEVVNPEKDTAILNDLVDILNDNRRVWSICEEDYSKLEFAAWIVRFVEQRRTTE